jgi:murein DD-endopeptidase MepM/ murein hydrolase activator NlpD
VNKLTRPFADSEPNVVLFGCALGVLVALAVLLWASPAFAGDGGGTSPDDEDAPSSSQPASAPRSTPSSTTQAYPAGFGRRMLRRGARGGDVRYLQGLLGRLGFRTGVDGMFGSGTAAKVRAWERSVHGRVDGRVPPGQAREMLRRAGTATQAEPAPSGTTPSGEYAFPIVGKHSYGTSINRYGAPRSGHTHGGQDILADCGQKLVAAHAGKVSTVDAGGDAGNYLVIQSTDKTDMVYMHMRSLAAVRKGQTVTAGQFVGYVGDTGDATACHLHFELWTQHWWDGGHSFDPLPRLKQWAAAG